MIIEKFIVRGGDNYNYIIVSEKTREAAVVDPLDAEETLRRIKEKGYIVKYILNTHSHGDHTGGNKALREKTDAFVYGYKGSMQADRYLDDGDELHLEEVSIKILYTPGHTQDSICLLSENKLFTGDTVFLSGGGNCWSGDPEKLYESFSQKIIVLPDDTELFVGHEYAVRNLEFAKSLEPANKNIIKKLQEVKNQKENSSTIKEEKLYNPFFRFKEKTYYEKLAKRVPNLSFDARIIFLATRNLRNRW